MRKILQYALLLACLVLHVARNGQVTAAAVMSVDLGSEWMKVGVVKPGTPMEIALNNESKRKTLAIIAFRDGKRFIGEDAQTTGIRFPPKAYAHLMDLLGKPIDHPIVKLYGERFPYHKIIGEQTRNTVVFSTDSGNFSVEELVAQLLAHAKSIAEVATYQTVTECVLTVPVYFNQAEREAILGVARLAGLKVLQLINDYAAVALNYAVFNPAEINETAHNFVFYDMGAYKTTVSVVQFQLVKDNLTKINTPVLRVLGVGYDRTLGGLEMQLRLRDYLADEFNAKQLTKLDVRSSPRSLAKLFKEAGRVKNVLSANNDHYAQIEGLIDDKDFKLQVSRAKFEELCEDMWTRVTKPMEDALARAKLTVDDIKKIVLIGGGTRVPRVQEIITAVFKDKLSKSLNADEAATIGAVYKAADLSIGFKVKKIVLKDAVLTPLQLLIEREADSEPSSAAVGATKAIKRVLFAPMSPYPARKAVTFNKRKNFEFYFQYANASDDVSLSGELKDVNISQVQVNVEHTIEAHKGAQPIGARIYVNLDESGILHCSKVEYIFEKSAATTETAEEAEPGIFAKLNDLFNPEQTETGTNQATLKDAPEEPNSQEAKETEEATKSEEGADVHPKEKTPSRETPAAETATLKEKLATKPSPKNETVRVIAKHTEQPLYPVMLEEASFKASLEKIEKIDSTERERTRLESSINNLASFINELRESLDQEAFGSCATDEEKTRLLDECSKLSDWLDEYFESVGYKEYEDKLSELKKLSQPIFERYREHEERSDAVDGLQKVLKNANEFLDSAKTFTKESNPDKSVYTSVEIETLGSLLRDTAAWLEVETKAQNDLKRNEDVRLTIKHLHEKISHIDREIKYLINKMKIWKPKAKPLVQPKSAGPNNGTATPPSSNVNATADSSTQAETPEVNPDTVNQNETSFHSEL